MNTRRVRLVAAGITVIVAIVGLVLRNQVRVYRGRQARAALMLVRHPAMPQSPEVVQQRQALFDLLKPVALNCQLERFGEAHDGGYLMCGNLLDTAQSGYSYGINGYDQWGCDISSKLSLTVHQYDCFNTTRPSCSSGKTVFHAECVGDTAETLDGRIFDTVKDQFASNGDALKHIVLKIDVEGAEWDSLLSAPDATLEQIDQMSVEFHWGEDGEYHWVPDDKYLRVVERLRQFFEVAHIHFNNSSCVADLEPFPTWAFEVLFVNKRLAIVDPSRKAEDLTAFDAQNNPSIADCQPKAR